VSAIDPQLPGAELVAQGLEDLAEGRLTEASLLVTAAAPRLHSLGIEFTPAAVEMPLHHLYELLSTDDAVDPHSRYNALVARIVSFARGAERAAAG